MRFFISLSALISLFISSMLAFNLPPNPLIANFSLGSISSTWMRDSKLECSDSFGMGLTDGSCENAWSKIPREVEPKIFSQRSHSVPGIPLPFRYLSGEFRCNLRGIDWRKQSTGVKKFSSTPAHFCLVMSQTYSALMMVVDNRM